MFPLKPIIQLTKRAIIDLPAKRQINGFEKLHVASGPMIGGWELYDFPGVRTSIPKETDSFVTVSRGGKGGVRTPSRPSGSAHEAPFLVFSHGGLIVIIRFASCKRLSQLSHYFSPRHCSVRAKTIG